MSANNLIPVDWELDRPSMSHYTLETQFNGDTNEQSNNLLRAFIEIDCCDRIQIAGKNTKISQFSLIFH